MTSLHKNQVKFNSNITISHTGGQLSSDSGLVLVKELMNIFGFSELAKQHIHIEDERAYFTHDNLSILEQFIMQLIAGYSADSAANLLRQDPVFKAVLGRKELASQSSLSRFLDRLSEENIHELQALNQELIDKARLIRNDTELIIDLDSTHSDTFGYQEQTDYNTHYQTYGYHPLVAFDGLTGDFLKAELRSGNQYTSKGVKEFLTPLLEHYNHSLPNTDILVRGDSGFATPGVYDSCESKKSHYVIRLKNNRRLGVIIAVYLLSLVEKGLRKVIPDAIDIIVTPTISLLVVGMMTIFLIMPIAGFVSTSLVGAINWVLQVGGAVAGFILGASFLPLVMFGLHQILTPIHIEMIAATGKTVLLPILAMAGAGQVGAAFALWLKCRQNKQLTNIIKGSLPVGILGIGEPLIYAVTLPLGRPFVTACLGGGIGGAVLGAIGGVGATAIGPSGVALIPLIADGQWPAYVMGLVAAYIGGFILTYFFGVPQTAQEASEITGSPSDTMEALDNL
ncbi:IS1380 family transposase [Aerococcus viridans]|uniref:IS1380 family transposase n=11 Tax=Bacilli TaxID=91061 RepID=UPI003AAFE724